MARTMPSTALRNLAQEWDEWLAQPRQRVFLRDFASVYEILYGGDASGGKSDALLAFSIRRRVHYPGTSGVFFRRTYGELANADGAIPRSLELLSGTDAHWNGTERRW